MFSNTPAVTIWEKTTVNHSTAYIRHQTGAAYWEETHGETVNGITRDPDDRVLIVIHADKIGGYIPQPDDRIMKGAVAGEKPPQNALTVTSVKDFRYGSDMVRHIEVTAR